MLTITKQMISVEIEKAMYEQRVSYRELEKLGTGFHAAQVCKIVKHPDTGYTLDTLLNILDALNLEIQIKPKGSGSNKEISKEQLRDELIQYIDEQLEKI